MTVELTDQMRIYLSNSRGTTLTPSDWIKNEAWFALPEDFEHIAGRKGFRFRDTFTKLCIYLLAKEGVVAVADDYVVVCTEAGNTEALGRFLADCFPENGAPFGSQFANATTSASATNLTIKHGICGGNLTVNSGADSILMGVLAASFYLRRNPRSRVHLFFGNVFCGVDGKRSGNTLPKSGAHYLVIGNSGPFEIEIMRTHSAADGVEKTIQMSEDNWFHEASAGLNSIFNMSNGEVGLQSSGGYLRLSKAEE